MKWMSTDSEGSDAKATNFQYGAFGTTLADPRRDPLL
jgi:hypothetical protein